jgi:hypothetical protein
MLSALAMLTGCAGESDKDADASPAAATPVPCQATVLATQRSVGERIYDEGVESERTRSAYHLIGASSSLRDAVERGDAAAALQAAKALIATGHMDGLTLLRGGRVLASAGTSQALAPLTGNIVGASGSVVGQFVTSVWANRGLIAEITGVTGAGTIVRSGTLTVAGKFRLPATSLPDSGTLTLAGARRIYTSFPAAAYPDARPARVYLVRSLSTTKALCGATAEDTTVNALAQIARAIYRGEAGPRARFEVRRVQHSAPLRRAVARRDPAATRRAVVALLNQHIVRLRVSAGGQLLADVGGPFVLAPVHAALHSGGRTTARIVLSIQDDEGYLRLARRLAGVDVLMYMGNTLVKNSLGPAPGTIPEQGRAVYRGHRFRVFTVHAGAFPSGPLRITVLVPVPYQ